MIFLIVDIILLGVFTLIPSTRLACHYKKVRNMSQCLQMASVLSMHNLIAMILNNTQNNTYNFVTPYICKTIQSLSQTKKLNVYTTNYACLVGMHTIILIMLQYHKFSHPLQMGQFVKQITCTDRDDYYIGFGILVGYRIVLCIIGCVLAFQNRKVNIPELRESKQVGLATYAFLFTVILEVALVSAVEDARILVILLLLERQCATTLLLLVLFVPKVCTILLA